MNQNQDQLLVQKSNFQLAREVNVAFGNPSPSGDFELDKIRKQCANIPHEYCELLVAMGYNHGAVMNALAAFEEALRFAGAPDDSKWNMTKVRDSLGDIHMFTYGAQHLMNIDADRDFQAIVDQLYTRFVKDDADLYATLDLHRAKGVTDVYFEGDYPRLIVKSLRDQPDAPKGKFLKSASAQKEPAFYKL